MKHRNMMKKYGVINLQLFAENDNEGGNEDDSEDDSENEDDEEEDPDEKKFSQKDMDDAVKKRLARERRKWQREQQKTKEDAGGKKEENETGNEESEKARKAAEDRALKAETKVACLEAGVAKDAVDDVTALAHAYMATDEELDLEDAIEKVVKKYPHFKRNSSDDSEEESTRGKAWGERLSGGRGAKKMSGVEKRFYELNPDLKR